MTTFFLILELFIYVFAIYIMVNKQELGIIYLPVLFFAYVVTEPVLPQQYFYGTIAFYLCYLLIKNRFPLLKENVFAVLIFCYFILLLFNASSTIKYSWVFSVLLYFLSLPIISSVYKQHTWNEVFDELVKSALIVLIIFIANVVFSTVTKYTPPTAMYSFRGGILYGHLAATNFNVLGLALFVVLLKILKKKDLFTLGVYIVAMAFILLTMRRSAMLVSVIGIPLALISTFTQDGAQKVIGLLVVGVMLGGVIYLNTDFLSMFKERYETRDLEDRSLSEEKRFSEYDIILTDMFVYNDYSPWTGFRLFDSAGNYGRGVYYDRTLHSDLASIAHGSGLIGVFLYLCMAIRAFSQSYRSSKSKYEKIIFLFSLIAFGLYTVTGRFTQADAMLFIFLICNLSLTVEETEEEAVAVVEEVPPSNFLVKQYQ